VTADLRQVAETRIREAKILLDAGEASGAYYLAGYAVECALKAKIASSFVAYQVPSLDLVKKVYTHDLPALVGIANLNADLTASLRADPDFAANWRLVCEWNESSRYESFAHGDAAELIGSITDPDHGILQWIEARW
jgi:hypothetical protein